MTKGELLVFLMPYADDIRIMVEEDMGLMDDANPRYVIAAPIDECAEHGVEPGEGFVLL